tara:strand:- start:46143 stop:46772 length:630 start_codon:yes stop_codon:yes gene_type:complete
VKVQCDDLAALLAVLTGLYKPDLGSVITKELEEIDARRDSALVGIEMQIKSFAYHFEPAKQEAAQALINSLTTYGSGTSRFNYQAESTTIDSIVAKWENDPELVSALTTLNMPSWVTELKTANKLFDDRYLVRLKEDAMAPEENTVEVRSQIIQSYRTLLAHLQAHATLSIDNSYTETVKQINLLIEQFNKLVAGRSSTKEEEEVLTQE